MVGSSKHEQNCSDQLTCRSPTPARLPVRPQQGYADGMRRGAGERPPRKVRFARWTAKAAPVPVAPVFALLFFGPLLAASGATGAGIGLVVVAGYYAWRATRRWREVATLEIGPGDVPVAMTVDLIPAGIRTGEDVGVLATVDGWLVFRGRRSEWSVRAADVDRILGVGTFEFTGPRGIDRRVRLRPLRFLQELTPMWSEWRRSAGEAGEPLFPPVRAGRPVALGGTDDRLLLGIAAVVGGLVFLVSKEFSEPGWPFVVVAVVTVLIIGRVIAEAGVRRDLARADADYEPPTEAT